MNRFAMLLLCACMAALPSRDAIACSGPGDPALSMTGYFCTNHESRLIFDSMFDIGKWADLKLRTKGYSGQFNNSPPNPTTGWRSRDIISALDDMTLAVMSMHGGSTGCVVFEYHSAVSAAQASAAAQGLVVYDGVNGSQANCEVIPFGSYHGLVLWPSGITKLISDTSTEFASHMAMFLISCYGSGNGARFDSARPVCSDCPGDKGFFGWAGFSGSFSPEDAFGDVDIFWKRIFCLSGENYLDNFKDAADGLDPAEDLVMIGAGFPAIYENTRRHEAIKPDPCKSCAGTDERFRFASYKNDVLSWEYDNLDFVDAFEVREYDCSGRVVRSQTVKPSESQTQELYIELGCDGSRGEIELVALRGDVPIEATMGVFWDTEECRRDTVSGDEQVRLVAPVKSVKCSLADDSNLVIVGASLSLVEQAVSYYSDSRVISYMASPAISASDVKDFYGSAVSSAGGGAAPYLLIVGPMGRSAYCVPSAEMDDPGSECGNSGQVCFSDLLLTDHDSNGAPNGPVSRIIARSEQELANVLYLAGQYNSRIGVDPMRHTAFLCQDVVSNYVRNINRWRDVYRDIGSPMWPTILASQLPAQRFDRWNAVAEVVNSGVAEVVVSGQAGGSNPDYS